MQRSRYLAGVEPGSVEFFVERVTEPAEFGAAIDRWKGLRDAGYDVTALGLDDGGTVAALVGLGVRYPGSEALEQAV